MGKPVIVCPPRKDASAAAAPAGTPALRPYTAIIVGKDPHWRTLKDVMSKELLGLEPDDMVTMLTYSRSDESFEGGDSQGVEHILKMYCGRVERIADGGTPMIEFSRKAYDSARVGLFFPVSGEAPHLSSPSADTRIIAKPELGMLKVVDCKVAKPDDDTLDFTNQLRWIMNFVSERATETGKQSFKLFIDNAYETYSSFFETQ